MIRMHSCTKGNFCSNLVVLKNLGFIVKSPNFRYLYNFMQFCSVFSFRFFNEYKAHINVPNSFVQKK
ncbi:hypothetical protein LCGC14_2555850 [marine sediment metagenome]|uniref:Uncharacterized protein n=1 Tax=marine sediment metagenome TaxID=412755 RepID=A0A0F9AM21_9ZZZZ